MISSFFSSKLYFYIHIIILIFYKKIRYKRSISTSFTLNTTMYVCIVSSIVGTRINGMIVADST